MIKKFEAAASGHSHTSKPQAHRGSNSTAPCPASTAAQHGGPLDVAAKPQELASSQGCTATAPARLVSMPAPAVAVPAVPTPAVAPVGKQCEEVPKSKPSKVEEQTRLQEER